MKTKMNADQFFSYASKQIAKAKKEDEEDASKRLEALHKATEIAKESFTTSARAMIPVFTDPMPTQTVDPQAAAKSNDGKGNFASNLDELNSRLAKLKGDAKKDEEDEDVKKRLHGIDPDGFPDDLNDPELIGKGEKKGPFWGYDNESVPS